MEVTKMDEIFDRLNKVFRDFFDDEEIELEEETTADDIDDWDSLNHITLMAAVEDEFGIRLSMGEVSGLKNVGELAQAIERKLS